MNWITQRQSFAIWAFHLTNPAVPTAYILIHKSPSTPIIYGIYLIEARSICNSLVHYCVTVTCWIFTKYLAWLKDDSSYHNQLSHLMHINQSAIHAFVYGIQFSVSISYAEFINWLRMKIPIEFNWWYFCWTITLIEICEERSMSKSICLFQYLQFAPIRSLAWPIEYK